MPPSDVRTISSRDLLAKGVDLVDPDEKEAEGDYSAEGPNQQVKNEFLSGYYVISEIIYTYDKESGKIQQKLKLLRREWPIPAQNKDN